MMLLEAGADPSAEFAYSSSSSRSAGTAIVHAAVRVAEAGDAAVMRAFLARGLDPRRTAAGDALIASAQRGYDDLVRLLLDAGVNVNYRDRTGRSALTEAIRIKHRPLIALLEKAGASEW